MKSATALGTSSSSLLPPTHQMTSMEYVVNANLFDYYWDRMIFECCETCMTLVVYGIYLNLFILSLYTLARRKTRGRNVLLVASCAMVLLGTVQAVVRFSIAAEVVQLSRQLVHEGHKFPPSPEWVGAYPALIRMQNVVFSFNNLVTDALFLYRCYVIWGSQLKIIILPGVFTLSTFATACMSTFSIKSESRTPYIIALVTNLVLMALTAGRIWWIRREAFHAGLDDTIRSRYRTAIAIILESGALYSVCAILLAVTWSIESPMAYDITFGFSLQALNIVPTLTIVRIGLGHTIDDPINLVDSRAAEPASGVELHYIV
ncbi:hypothetical protein B0H17DRAFT_1031665 [Mycena rosella]|uniref:Uncharacterized protein n=1 Tax=Mycena rosella TaxID=1033263 RepID=A0AAD7GYM4_MYCRO|nr:hypothetical protein B0H17DRAFT_1031665 [Mycena rosella]